ncbi:protein arginine N-methyltransferase 7 isoform X2 [Chrysoperla carnea]|nr:protein arginine N-methyltransferase 7 isoform X2 [Chrysoperla carnea]
MSVFTQEINPMTGIKEWVLKDEHYDYFQEIARSAFADMLHDTERNQKYFQAIQAAVTKMKAAGKKAHVLDIGTGTGLLSMIAVKSGADSVIACEAFRPMSQCALKVIKDNHFEFDIKVIPKRSTELTVGEDGDLKHRANILVTEVFDTELIGEGALSTFRHAQNELLTDDCIVVPSSATIYAQVVESPLIQNWNILKSIANSDGEILLNTPSDLKKCPGSVNLHDVQLSQLPPNSFNTIISPTPVFHFNWSKPLKFTQSNQKLLKVERDGVPHAVFVWWDLCMDTESKILLSCAPYWAHPDFNQLIKDSPNTEYKQDLIPWRDHWMQAIYYLPQNHIFVQKNDEVTLISCHDEYSLWFNLKKATTAHIDIDFVRPMCDCLLHIAYSRTRIGQINDGKRNKKYINVLEQLIDSKSICLSINDGSFISLAMLKLGAKHLYCIESDTIGQNLLRKYAEFNNIGADRLTILGKLSDLKIEQLNEIQVVFSEPNFLTSLLPWDNFQYYILFNSIREHLPKDVTIIPSKGTIKGVAVEFLDLYKIRAPLGECEGFIMDKFDKMIDLASKLSDYPVEPQPLWEYPCKALSEPFQMFELNLNNDLSSHDITNEIDLIGSGKCNGVVLWMDWDLNGNGQNIISTGPTSKIEVNERIVWDMHTRQGVYLMPKAKQLIPNTKLRYQINVRPTEFRINFEFTFKKIKKSS